MKKLVSLLLCSLMIFACALAAAEDYTAYTTEELLSTLTAIQRELNDRAAVSPANKVLYEADGLRISIHSTSYRRGELEIMLLVENDTDNEVAVSHNQGTANGWTVKMGFSSSNVTLPHTKRKDCYVTLRELSSGADINSEAELLTATISLKVKITTPDGKSTTVLTPAVNCTYTPADGLLVIPQD